MKNPEVYVIAFLTTAFFFWIITIVRPLFHWSVVTCGVALILVFLMSLGLVERKRLELEALKNMAKVEK